MLNIFKTLLFSLLLLSTFTISSFAEAEGSGAREELKYFFDSQDPFQEKETRKDELGNSVGDGDCQIRCRVLNPNPSPENDNPNARPVADKYVTKIVDFDATTGITTCDVYSKVDQYDQTKKHSIMANRKDIDCLAEFKAIVPNYDDKNLASVSNLNKSNENLVTLDGASYDRSKLTVSKFVAGLATLDDDIINIKDTVGTGTLVRTDGQNVYSISDYAPKDSSGLPKVKKEERLYNAMDKLSRENMGYYADLIYEMDKMNDYLISYLFVFISLYYMFIFFGDIALKKLAKKPLTYEKPWQTRFSVIVIATAFFFLPVRYDANYSATLFQNTWKFFVDESTSIADRANMIGMQVLMKNTYNTTGATGVQSEANLKTLAEQQGHLVGQYYTILKDQCDAKYPHQTTFQETLPHRVKAIEDLYGNNEIQFIYRGCRAVEARYKVAKTAYEQYSYMLDRIKASYDSTDQSGASIIERLREIDAFMVHKVTEIGWYSVALAPTLKAQVQTAYMQGGDVPPPVDSDDEAKINEANATEIAKRELNIEGQNKLSNQLTLNPEAQKSIGALFGNSIFSKIPGYQAMQTFVNQLDSNAVSIILNIWPKDNEAMNLEKISQIENFDKFKLSTFLEKHWLVTILPIVGAFMATALKIIVYLYKLILFTFISPFIVVFALTTADTRRITDFLVTAVVIFLEPVIIVISVYLALFLYYMFNDLFITLVQEQFLLSLLSSDSFYSEFTFVAIKESVNVFAAVISTYIMWKIIMNMGDFIFNLIGLQNKNIGSQFVNEMFNKQFRA